ncbi:MAG: hypothetical protein ACR2QM_14315 [Longimicrobiales bacterium]
MTLLAAVIGVTGCAAFLANADVSMVSLRATPGETTDQSVEATFQVLNRNTGETRLVGVLYRMLIREEGKWIEVGEGYSVQDIRLPKDEAVDFSYTFPVEAVDGRSPVRGITEGEYRLEGELRVMGGLGQVQVPFSFDGPTPGS